MTGSALSTAYRYAATDPRQQNDDWRCDVGFGFLPEGVELQLQELLGSGMDGDVYSCIARRGDDSLQLVCKLTMVTRPEWKERVRKNNKYLWADKLHEGACMAALHSAHPEVTAACRGVYQFVPGSDGLVSQTPWADVQRLTTKSKKALMQRIQAKKLPVKAKVKMDRLRRMLPCMILMDVIEGETLASTLGKNSDPQGIQRAVETSLRVLSVVGDTPVHKFTHGDCHAENIFVGARKIADFQTTTFVLGDQLFYDLVFESIRSNARMFVPGFDSLVLLNSCTNSLKPGAGTPWYLQAARASLLDAVVATVRRLDDEGDACAVYRDEILDSLFVADKGGPLPSIEEFRELQSALGTARIVELLQSLFGRWQNILTFATLAVRVADDDQDPLVQAFQRWTPELTVRKLHAEGICTRASRVFSEAEFLTGSERRCIQVDGLYYHGPSGVFSATWMDNEGDFYVDPTTGEITGDEGGDTYSFGTRTADTESETETEVATSAPIVGECALGDTHMTLPSAIQSDPVCGLHGRVDGFKHKKVPAAVGDDEYYESEDGNVVLHVWKGSARRERAAMQLLLSTQPYDVVRAPVNPALALFTVHHDGEDVICALEPGFDAAPNDFEETFTLAEPVMEALVQQGVVHAAVTADALAVSNVAGGGSLLVAWPEGQVHCPKALRPVGEPGLTDGEPTWCVSLVSIVLFLRGLVGSVVTPLPPAVFDMMFRHTHGPRLRATSTWERVGVLASKIVPTFDTMAFLSARVPQRYADMFPFDHIDPRAVQPVAFARLRGAVYAIDSSCLLSPDFQKHMKSVQFVKLATADTTEGDRLFMVVRHSAEVVMLTKDVPLRLGVDIYAYAPGAHEAFSDDPTDTTNSYTMEYATPEDALDGHEMQVEGGLKLFVPGWRNFLKYLTLVGTFEKDDRVRTVRARQLLFASVS